MVSRPRHVRSSPQSKHSTARVARPLCASNGLGRSHGLDRHQRHRLWPIKQRQLYWRARYRLVDGDVKLLHVVVVVALLDSVTGVKGGEQCAAAGVLAPPLNDNRRRLARR
jgi:hypothetical protein